LNATFSPDPETKVHPSLLVQITGLQPPISNMLSFEIDLI